MTKERTIFWDKNYLKSATGIVISQFVCYICAGVVISMKVNSIYCN